MFPSGSTSSTGQGGSFGGMSGADIFSNINSLFGSMNNNMFGGSSGGSGGGGFGSTNPATQLQTGPNLTGDIYSGYPYLSGLGGNLYNFGSGLAGLTPGLLQGGLGLTGQGFGTVGQGVQQLGPTMQLLRQLQSGNPTTTAQVLGPQMANASQIETGALNNVSQGAPVGGYRASTMATLPQTLAAQGGNAALSLIPWAATQNQNVSALLGQLGGEQANIGQGVSGLGLNTGQLGLQYAQAGMGGIAQALQNELQKQQLNYSQPSALQQVIGSISSLLGAARGGGTGVMGWG